MEKKIEEAEMIEEIIERPYELRALKDGDLFPILKIIKKLGIKEFKGAFQQFVDGKSVQEVGLMVIMEMAGVIIENTDKAEEDIYHLWSDISGIPADGIREMEFGTLPLMIMDTFKGASNTSFFKVLSKLL